MDAAKTVTSLTKYFRDIFKQNCKGVAKQLFVVCSLLYERLRNGFFIYNPGMTELELAMVVLDRQRRAGGRGRKC